MAMTFIFGEIVFVDTCPHRLCSKYSHSCYRCLLVKRHSIFANSWLVSTKLGYFRPMNVSYPVRLPTPDRKAVTREHSTRCSDRMKGKKGHCEWPHHAWPNLNLHKTVGRDWPWCITVQSCRALCMTYLLLHNQSSQVAALGPVASAIMSASL